MKERAEWAIDQRRTLVERQVAHVAFAQVELNTRLSGTRSRLLEHRRRRVDPDDRPTCRPRNRDGDSAVPNGKLDERPVGLARKLHIEGDILSHVRRPLVVATHERVGIAHGPNASRGWESVIRTGEWVDSISGHPL